MFIHMRIKAFILRRRAKVDKADFRKMIIDDEENLRKIMSLIEHLRKKVGKSNEYELEKVDMGINEKE